MGPDTTELLVEKLSYYRGHKKDYVFEVGSVGDKYYIILAGKVGVEVPFQDPDGKENEKIMQ